MAEKTLKQLLDFWNKEKEEYRYQEVGSGVQKFVKEVFKNQLLFNLSEGKLNTPDNKRKKEFLEEAKKKGRRADVVIFIDGEDIIIPVEVEKHGNIKAGISQLFQYQADWIKKFGILTDGYEWRFYNNTFIEKTFIIDNILNKPEEFLTFWNEYTQPEYYYRSFFDKKGQPEISEHLPNVDDVREDFFIDITKLIENFKNKLNVKGYFAQENDDITKDKKALEITYAYLIQFILYKTLVDNGFPNFQNYWEVRIEEIKKALNAERYGDVLRKIKSISNEISDKIYKPFSDEQAEINKRLEQILDQPKQEIGDVSVWLDILLFINRYNFANVQNEIFGYIYENYLKQYYEDEGKKGQYFTDPAVVEFMLEEMGYTKEKLQQRYSKDKDSISIIDPSCGSGTFLYNATARIVESFFDKAKSQKTAKETEKIINENVFGLDIAEFPLYLAEMNILMRMLRVILNQQYNNSVEQKIKVFKTPDSIAEFLDTPLNNTVTDAETEFKQNKGQLSLFSKALILDYDSFVRDKKDLGNLKESLFFNSTKPRYRFDFVIGNPPYVAYNEISKQKLLFVKLLQDKKVQMSNIYGVNLNTVPGRIKAYAPKPNLYSFFISLGLALLKDGGKLCYIIPQTILTAADLDVIRYHLSSFVTIDKIINFSGKMFVGRGIKQNKPVPTSSLILIITKATPTKLHEVEIVNYKDSNDDIIDCLININKGKKISKSSILQNKLRQNVENWNFIKSTKEEVELIDEYHKNTESMDVYREYEFSRKLFNDIFIIDGSYNIPTKTILKSITDNRNYYDVPVFDTNYYSIQKYGFYPKNVEIKIAKGGQGLKVISTKYKVLWNYIKPQKFFYIGDNNNILPRFQQFCIGSNNKNEIIYLFSLLNHPLTFLLFEKYLRSENEKDILVGVKFIKEFIRVPKITPFNEHIKEEIINSTVSLLEMEKQTFEDYVDFKGVMLQKFDNIETEGNNLIIQYSGNTVKCRIKSEPELVKQFVNNLKKESIFLDENIGNLAHLKEHTLFDRKLQAEIKDYVDDLVYALYFKIKLTEPKFDDRQKIKTECSKHKFYKLVNP